MKDQTIIYIILSYILSGHYLCTVHNHKQSIS